MASERRAPRAGLANGGELAMEAVGILVAEIERRESVDPVAAERLGRDVLGVLLGPRGRPVLPHATAVIARLVARSASSWPRVSPARPASA
jgi:hypothetical protein